MNINVKDTFKIASRNLFVIVTDTDLNNLVGMTYVFDHLKKSSFPIFSIETVTILNSSMAGITIRYEKNDDLPLMGLGIGDIVTVE